MNLECIIPPYILTAIATRGSELQKKWAKKALARTREFRMQRRALAEFPPSYSPVESLAVQAVTLFGFMISGMVAAPPGKHRVIYNAQNTTNLPGVTAREEGDPPTNDPAVDEAYDYLGATYDLYYDIYGRNSIDDNGMSLAATVHYDEIYENAAWNGQQMIFGDGDEALPEEERIFNRFTKAVEIVGHELTHGVVQYTSRFVYWDQHGALSESFADVFGSLVKQYLRNQKAAVADWLIGEGLLTSNVNGQALRSMKAPGTAYDDPLLNGKDPQPDHMDDFAHVDYDNGGVHINSGIPNHAFYVASQEIGGNAWEKAGRIWYEALLQLQPRAEFQDTADLTFEIAGNKFGNGSAEQKAVQKGWRTVGIQVS